MMRMSWMLVVAAMVISVARESASAQILGSITHVVETGAVTGAEMRFNIYLPPGYSTSVRRYPVVYYLHGIGGSETGQHLTRIPPVFEAGVQQGLVRPAIIVFPGGYSDAFWADSIGGDKPAESMVIQDLIPYIDANYRTVARPDFRVIIGYSMGGFGAVKFFTKFPELFTCCVEFDGAIMYWEQLVQRHPALAESIFGNSSAYFDQFSPWTWPVAHAGVIGPSVRIKMMTGLLVDYGRAYRDHLASVGISVEYSETACSHDLACILAAEGPASVAFIESHLCDPCPGDVNGDGTTNVADFNAFAQAFGATVPAGAGVDLNGDGVVNASDFALFASGFGCSL